MPKKGGYVCNACEKKLANPGALKRHKARLCEGRPTTGSRETGNDTQEGNDQGNDSRETIVSLPNSALTQDETRETTGRETRETASTPTTDDLVVGGNDRFPVVSRLAAPGVNSPDAIETVRDRAVIDYLGGHTGLLEPRELRFFHGVKYRVYGNGGLSPAQRAWLYEIEAVVKGLLEEIARETEQSRRAQHWLAAKDPKHKRQGCDLCREKEIEDAEADKRADIGLLDDAKVLQQTARRKGLRVPTIEELMGEALVARVTARSLQGDPAARACIENLREFSA